MSQADSFDKVVQAYFAAVTAQAFMYKGKLYSPKPLQVSANFFHDYTCKLGCAGCCPRFSLDYLPSESRPDYAHATRSVEINLKQFTLYSKRQSPAPGKRFCDNVDLATGACGVHGKQPFSCDFETLRFTHFPDIAYLGTRPYGRGWNMMRVDGERGALCEFPKTASDAARAEGLRKLQRLQQWCEYFDIVSKVPAVLEWASVAPLTSQPKVF